MALCRSLAISCSEARGLSSLAALACCALGRRNRMLWLQVTETPTQNGLSTKENLLLHKVRSPEPGQLKDAVEDPAFGHPRGWPCSWWCPRSQVV